jgi:uncharacterized CHY-type Zn-finger protein
MPTKLSYEAVYNYIKDKGYELLSKEYITNRNLLQLKCGKCEKVYEQTLSGFKMGFYHPKCITNVPSDVPSNGYKKSTRLKPIICGMCQNEFQPTRSSSKVCSMKCSQDIWKTDEYKAKAKINGQNGGKVSAQKQSRRSQNEIYFAELCSEYFTITTNEQFFDGWDADVIIHSDKIAILWNGAWHYKQISKTQSLKQVQARDIVKTAIIKKKEYAPYVIIDMGKYDKPFVEQEFAVFLLMRMATKILE